MRRRKRVAAEAAAALVPRGATVGLGTGSTVELLLPVLAGLDLGLRCVATSPRTEGAALAVGLEVEPFLTLDRVDIAIDGADQVDPQDGSSRAAAARTRARRSSRWPPTGSS